MPASPSVPGPAAAIPPPKVLAGGATALFEAIVATAADLPARRAVLARAVAPLRAEAGRTATLAMQLAAAGSLVGSPGGPRGS